MGASKIVNEQEIKKWFDQGLTYPQMVKLYKEKYNLEVGHSMFGNLRRRRGWDRRNNRDDNLIPWAVKREHRYLWAISMLRLEGNKRAGKRLTPKQKKDLSNWLAKLERDDCVVYYDPDTKEGFHFVKRLASDTDIIRKPQRKTTQQVNTDNREIEPHR